MRKLAWALFPFCGAVFLAVYLVPEGWHVTAGICCLILSGLSLFAQGKTRRKILLTAVCMGLGFLWCGGYHALWCAPAEAYIGEKQPFSAQVLEYPAETDYGVSVTVRVRPKKGRPFRACLYLNSGFEELTLGDRLTGRADFSTAEVIHDREVSYFTARGIHVLGKKVKLKQCVHPDRLPLRLYPRRFSHWLQGNLEALYQGDVCALLQALTTGQRRGMSDYFRNALSRSGLSHMTAVSGMHVVFFMSVFLWLPGDRRWKLAAAYPLMLLFALCTGLAPSVVRASVMEGILLLGELSRRRYDPPTSLAVALFLLLVQNPWAAGSAGLQLSFAAVAGIHLLLPRLTPQMGPKMEWKGMAGWLLRRWWKLRQSAALTLSATVFTLPLCAYYFGAVSVIAPFSNLLVLWTVAPLMLGGLLTGILQGFLPGLARLLALPVGALGILVTEFIKALGRLYWSAVDGGIPAVRWWLAACYTALLWRCVRQPRVWKKRLVKGGLAFLLLFCMTVHRMGVLRGDLTAVALDVGQGQSVALLSDSSAVAVDCGGDSASRAGDALAEYLYQLQMNELDLLVVTHYDSDHVNGAAELLERVHVKRILGPDIRDDSGNRAELERLAKAHGIIFQTVRKNRRVSFGSAAAQVFAPVGRSGDNDAGLSVLASAGAFDVLITGDMTGQMEEKLAKRERLSHVEVLVAGHHGSRSSTSTSFLEQITPTVAVISVGTDNSYGHPAQDTLDRLRGEKIKVYRTDLNGTVTVTDR